VKTYIKKTSYENIRIKVSITFPNVSFPFEIKQVCELKEAIYSYADMQ